MMSTAFIKAVLVYFPDSSIDLIVKAGFEKIPLPHRGKIIPFDKKSMSPIQFGRGLREYSYDVFFVLPPSFSSALMAYATKVPKRIGYIGSFRGFLLNPGTHYLKKHRTQHLVTEYQQLLDKKINPEEFYPELTVSETWTDKNISGLTKGLPKEFITIAPGVIFGSAKQWPVNYFKELASSIIDRGENVVVIGTKDDFELGQTLSKNNDCITNLCGETTLNQLIAVLSRSKLLVSNDSGTMHIMAALQKPQVAIFGSTSTVWTSPINKKAEVLTLNLDCAPCYKRECRFGHTNCLNDLKPEIVIDRVNRLLLKSD
ncbi:lipopolysaccharide heptosyltransferase II [bacterium]|nr:lipopolysaccharide heptosyltransferase II [bacterium]